MGGLSKEGQHPSTGPPTYQIIKVTNANHMSMMKTNLTTIPMCPRERFALYKSSSRLVLCYKKDWDTLLHFVYFIYLLLATIYLITKLSVTYNFSACRENLTENRLSFPSAPRGFDTLTYRKDYDRSPTLVGHQWTPKEKEPSQDHISGHLPKEPAK